VLLSHFRQKYTPLINILTLDIEDWQQSSPEVFDAAGIPRVSIPTLRTVQNTRKLMKILDECKARATCFVLGSVAEAFPGLIREIHDSGHEIASHGYHHLPIQVLKPEEFKADVARSLECLEQITGEKIKGYRAPYFSITRSTEWALPILADLGLEYDASLFPLNSRYYRFPWWDGAEHAERFPNTLWFGTKNLFELPSTTARILGQNLPLAGGAFLRLLPLSVFRWALRRANRCGHPGVFYLHPPDLDARDQDPHEPRCNPTFRKRLLQWELYVGRSGNERKLRKLLSEFPFTSIREWINSNSGDSGAAPFVDLKTP
jgi:polysaccharide deacetylase family protein (PEP-CTERM system associated)